MKTKKLISVFLAIFMAISVFSICFTASASGNAMRPEYISKITGDTVFSDDSFKLLVNLDASDVESQVKSIFGANPKGGVTVFFMPNTTEVYACAYKDSSWKTDKVASKTYFDTYVSENLIPALKEGKDLSIITRGWYIVGTTRKLLNEVSFNLPTFTEGATPSKSAYSVANGAPYKVVSVMYADCTEVKNAEIAYNNGTISDDEYLEIAAKYYDDEVGTEFYPTATTLKAGNHYKAYMLIRPTKDYCLNIYEGNYQDKVSVNGMFNAEKEDMSKYSDDELLEISATKTVFESVASLTSSYIVHSRDIGLEYREAYYGGNDVQEGDVFVIFEINTVVNNEKQESTFFEKIARTFREFFDKIGIFFKKLFGGNK